MDAFLLKYNFNPNFAATIFMDWHLKTSDFQYALPDERIAKYPLAKRDHAKLLFYRGGEIFHHHFYDLPSLLPPTTTLFFNDTRVIPARLQFRKSSGAQVEIFLLNPIDLNLPLQLALQTKGNVRWQCAIGNLKRWRQGSTLSLALKDLSLQATLVDAHQGIVEFSWIPKGLSFAEVVELCGQTPLPPYLHRDAEPVDKEKYQTVYSKFEGAVAAPTAGLHFTDDVFKNLSSKSIKTEFHTLHVSAGTFQPIKGENAAEHTMHAEQIVITRSNLDHLLEKERQLIPVGTTSMRTMESIYWYGVKLLLEGPQDFAIKQDDPYRFQTIDLPSREEALIKVASVIRDNKPIVGSTSIYIMPGYKFRVCNGLITNFHQPGSTLMLLVAALVGKNWRQIYGAALKNGYRFLSYGDSSLLIP